MAESSGSPIPGGPLVQPAQIAEASIPNLLGNLKLPEYRTRYRTRRELRGRDAGTVIAVIKKWTSSLDQSDPAYEHHLVEALWVSWGLNRVDEVQPLLQQLLGGKDYRARAAAVRVLRYSGHQIPDQVSLLRTAAADEHGRVRMEAVAAASWLGKKDGLSVIEIASKAVETKVESPKTAEAKLGRQRRSAFRGCIPAIGFGGNDHHFPSWA